jgi:hypothetical protein
MKKLFAILSVSLLSAMGYGSDAAMKKALKASWNESVGSTKSGSQRKRVVGSKSDSADDAAMKKAMKASWDESIYNPKSKVFKEKCAEMKAIAGKLPKGMKLFDTPGFGRCGFFALCALQFVKDNPGESVIRVTKDSLIACQEGLADCITNSILSDDPGVKDAIEDLRVVLLGNDKKYVNNGKVNWDRYLDDMRNGMVQMDGAFLPFVHKVSGLNVVVVKDTNENALGVIPDCGALVHWGLNHFMVALPEYVTELICQEQNDRWWRSLPGVRVCCCDENSDDD